MCPRWRTATFPRSRASEGRSRGSCRGWAGPRGTLNIPHSRGDATMHRRSLIAATLLMVLSAACGEGANPAAAPSAPATTDPTASGTASPSPAATPDASRSPTVDGVDPSGDPTGATQVTTYYVRSGPTDFFVEPVTVDLEQPTKAVARAAYTAAVEQDPVDPGLTRVVPDGTRLLDVTISDGLLTVDLSGELATSGGSAEELALRNQLAETGLQFDSVDAVRLLVDGQPVTDLWGHLDWSEPFVAEEFAVSPIVVTAPRWDATVAGPDVTLEGSANTFEATLELVLTDADGLILDETFTTATCGTGCRGTWTHTFTGLEPGRHSVVLRAPDPSGGEGPEPFTTEVTFTVQ